MNLFFCRSMTYCKLKTRSYLNNLLRHTDRDLVFFPYLNKGKEKQNKISMANPRTVGDFDPSYRLTFAVH